MNEKKVLLYLLALIIINLLFFIAFRNLDQIAIYFFIGLLFSCVSSTLITKNSETKNYLLSVSTIIFTLLILELGFLAKPIFNKQTQKTSESKMMLGTYSQSFGKDPNIGYGPSKPGSFTSHKKTSSGKTVYNVKYTISNDLIRLTPNCSESKDSYLFFGCSFTYGEGLEDTETLPFYFAKQSNCKFKSLNFGFHGYGPHHALRMLETNKVKDATKKIPIKGVILQTGSFHIGRVAGLSKWDMLSPKYEVKNQNATYVGPFFSRLTTKITSLLKKSKLFNYLFKKANYERKINNKDIKLYVSILKRMSEV